ncbi:hypothetical protein X801_07819 [Opisthorchis viverrini]|uniref:Uncharacterized protein n=1 Tax=Opisthorchis viverrini TaxID=6198 RepID=A0A1S8WPG8_OPIVI|nr:hypothetical protein X801_07819 [Opisthorchis viverrini]
MESRVTFAIPQWMLIVSIRLVLTRVLFDPHVAMW